MNEKACLKVAQVYKADFHSLKSEGASGIFPFNQ